jgi:hypothetical protein
MICDVRMCTTLNWLKSSIMELCDDSEELYVSNKTGNFFINRIYYQLLKVILCHGVIYENVRVKCTVLVLFSPPNC